MTDHPHRFHATGGDSLGKSFECHIMGREFSFSDQIKTVIAGIHGIEIADHAHFHVEGKKIEAHALLDEYRGKKIQVFYQHQDPSLIHEFEIPLGAN
jgi:hypothetical protein